MRLHVEIPLATAEPLSGLVAEVVPVDPDAAAEALARRWAGNLLQLTEPIIESIGSGRIIVNSGSLADDLVALEPHNWLGGGKAALTTHLERIEPALRASPVRLLIEPCSRHVIHDAQAALLFLQEQSAAPVGLALNPTALFEPSMLAFREDHLLRIAESLAPRCEMLILAGMELDEVDERFNPCSPEEGEFDLVEVWTACRAHLPAEAPVVLRANTRRLPDAALLERLMAAGAAGRR
ncbi:MAG: hypothetical protein IT430_15160 [Phycisphaerales bacterium]|nr:hypothetical protein [Phycisphaerales bacterium]